MPELETELIDGGKLSVKVKTLYNYVRNLKFGT